jgi:hypothetical protein
MPISVPSIEDGVVEPEEFHDSLAAGCISDLD